MAKILAVFTCYNRKEKTVKCLESLLNYNPDQNFSFIAVDDNSMDGTKEALQKFDNMKIIEGDGKCYYSGGMRLGINEGKKSIDSYEWVLFFNDDVEFFPKAITKLINFSRNSKDILIGATCDKQGKLSYGGVKKKSQFRPAFSIIMSGENREFCDTFNANCVLIPFDIFKALPNIDKRYTHSLGDYDYGLEARKRGIKLVASDFFVGVCDDNDIKGTWRDTNLKRCERLRKKESPKGLPWREWFYFTKKHYGIISACLSAVTPYLKIIFRRS